jgi:hypothetical protein
MLKRARASEVNLSSSDTEGSLPVSGPCRPLPGGNFKRTPGSPGELLGGSWVAQHTANLKSSSGYYLTKLNDMESRCGELRVRGGGGRPPNYEFMGGHLAPSQCEFQGAGMGHGRGSLGLARQNRPPRAGAAAVGPQAAADARDELEEGSALQQSAYGRPGGRGRRADSDERREKRA